jgi:hypothetical protein
MGEILNSTMQSRIPPDPWKRNVTSPNKVDEPRTIERGAGLYDRETIAHTNPWYDALIDDWEFFRQSYVGGANYIDQHLFKHPKEAKHPFGERKRRAVYPNHTRVVVDTYASQLFKRPIPREANTDGQATILQPFWNDVTATGVSADEFYEEIAQLTSIYGQIHILVDKQAPETEGEIVNRAQELEAGIRPVVRTIEPHNLVDWKVTVNGELEWAVVREIHESDRQFNEPPEPNEYRYRVWTRNTWELFRVELEERKESDGTTEQIVRYHSEAGPVEHGLGVVPIVTAFFAKRKATQPLSESLIKDLAPLVRRLFNLKSLIDEQIYAHVFNILMVSEGTFDRLEQIEWSVAGVIPVEQDTEGRTPFVPSYLSPDTRPIGEIQDQIRVTEGEIRLLSGLGRQNEGQAAESGIALAFKNVDKRALFSRFGQVLSDIEERVNKLALAWMNNGTGGLLDNVPKPSYKVELEPGEVENALRNGLRFVSIPNMPEPALKTATMEMIRAYLGPLVEQETLQTVLVEAEQQFKVPELPDSLVGQT